MNERTWLSLDHLGSIFISPYEKIHFCLPNHVLQLYNLTIAEARSLVHLPAKDWLLLERKDQLRKLRREDIDGWILYR